MKTKQQQLDTNSGPQELSQLLSLCAERLRTAVFEMTEDGGSACLIDFGADGPLKFVGETAENAARKAFAAVASKASAGKLLKTEPVDDLTLQDAMSAERFQAKAKNHTIGVTMPLALKARLAELATLQQESVAEVLRRLAAFGFDDFEQRTLFESARSVMQSLGQELQQWQGSKPEQVMVRLEPDYAVRLKSAAKDHHLSASEMGALCVAHGVEMSQQLELLEAKVQGFQGTASRDLAVQIGLGRSAGRLIAGVLSGNTRAPREVLTRLASVLATPESLLSTYFRKSFDQRIVPSYKAENGKPVVHTTAKRWETAVKTSKFAPEVEQELLQLGA